MSAFNGICYKCNGKFPLLYSTPNDNNKYCERCFTEIYPNNPICGGVTGTALIMNGIAEKRIAELESEIDSLRSEVERLKLKRKIKFQDIVDKYAQYYDTNQDTAFDKPDYFIDNVLKPILSQSGIEVTEE